MYKIVLIMFLSNTHPYGGTMSLGENDGFLKKKKKNIIQPNVTR